MFELHQIATWVSLTITPMTIAACCAVIYLFYPAFTHHAKEYKNKKLVTGTGFMIMGIVIGFIGDAFDNLWWGFAWNAHFFNSGNEEFLFENGVYNNVVFRQILTLIASAFHLTGSYMVATSAVGKMNNARANKAFNLVKVGAGVSLAYGLYLLLHI